jgi:hypothetical protein
MRKFWLMCPVVLAMPALASPDYRVAQDIPLGAGRLQVLEDSRLTPALEKTLWGMCADPVLALGDDAPEALPFRQTPVAPAKLRQLDRQSRVVSETVLEDQAPIARIEPRRLGSPAHPIILVRYDDDACMGSYSGQAVVFFALSGDRLTAAVAQDGHGHRQPVTGFESLKSGWRFVRTAPNDIIIEKILCRPDFDADKRDPDPSGAGQFLLRFITFHFDGRRWHFTERREPGYWESDDSFPAHRRFARPD